MRRRQRFPELRAKVVATQRVRRESRPPDETEGSGRITQFQHDLSGDFDERAGRAVFSQQPSNRVEVRLPEQDRWTSVPTCHHGVAHAPVVPERPTDCMQNMAVRRGLEDDRTSPRNEDPKITARFLPVVVVRSLTNCSHVDDAHGRRQTQPCPVVRSRPLSSSSGRKRG